MNATTQPAALKGAAGAPTAKPWLDSYPANITHTIDERRIVTLVDIFRAPVA